MSNDKLSLCLTVLFAATAGILADYLFYGKEIGVSFLIYILAIIAFSVIIAKRSEKKFSNVQILLLVSAVIMAAEVFLKASSFLNFFNKIGSIYLLFLAAILFEKNDLFSSRFLKYFTAPIAFFTQSFTSSAKFIDEHRYLVSTKANIGSKETRGVIRGIIMSLPVLALLGWFLYSADMVVQAYANKFLGLFHFKIDFELGFRILIIIAISYILLGIFSKIAGKSAPTAPEEEPEQKRSTGFIESMTVLALVELLFLAFIAIQFFYLFGGKSYVWGIDEYITYSEYAKSGFYELIKVAIVSFLLIYAVSGSSKIETLKEKKIFRFLSAALFVEISIILMSALKRLLLYVDGYGLTMQRFLAFGLLFWIFCIFLFFLCKIFLEKKNSAFIFMAFSLSIAVWLGINIANPDALIARVNIERFTEGKKIDPYYFTDLSDDAMPEIAKIFKLNIDEGIKEKVALDLDWKYALWYDACSVPSHSEPPYYSGYDIYNCRPILFSEKIKTVKTNPRWQSFNLSKNNAVQTLNSIAGEIDKYQIISWKELAVECENSATQCEKLCTNTAQAAPVDCKITCDSGRCNGFRK